MMVPLSPVRIIINSNDKDSLHILQNSLVKIQGISFFTEKQEDVGARGGVNLDIVSLIVSGLAIPSFLKAIEIYLSTRKIEVEIELPDSKTKLKFSGLDKDTLAKKIKELSSLLN
jgi:hypothetical protein